MPSVNGYDVHRNEPPAEEPPAEPPAPASGPDPDERSGPPTGLIVTAALAAAALLVLAGLSIPYLLQKASGSATADFSVGDCVIRSGDDAVDAECGAPGAYEIVAAVDSRDECPDPAQPAIEASGSPTTFYCLAPAGAADDEDPAESEDTEASDDEAADAEEQP